ncbi:MAG: gas vesicle protein [Nanoarchaeota archaeon]
MEAIEPTREVNATLVDLLDRVLDKGLIINADIIISVAGIPLIGVNLKAALAGMETMLKYGMMEDWDEAQRAIAREEHVKVPLKESRVKPLI